MLTYALPIIILVVLFLMNAIRILNEYERAVVFRLGRFLSVKGPGLIILIPILDKMVRTQLRIVTLDVPHQEVITQDNVSIKVSAVVYYRVISPQGAILEVEDYHYATSQLAQTTLRSVCGAAELDEILSQRDKLNAKIQSILDDQTDAWGIKVTSVEIKYIDLPQEMQRVMARQAEAEREKRAKVIAADGEYLAAAKLADAAKVISKHPAALQLRYLQTMLQMTAQAGNSAIIPIPLDMINVLKNAVSAPVSLEPEEPSSDKA